MTTLWMKFIYDIVGKDERDWIKSKGKPKKDHEISVTLIFIIFLILCLSFSLYLIFSEFPVHQTLSLSSFFSSSSSSLAFTPLYKNDHITRLIRLMWALFVWFSFVFRLNFLSEQQQKNKGLCSWFSLWLFFYTSFCVINSCAVTLWFIASSEAKGPFCYCRLRVFLFFLTFIRAFIVSLSSLFF